MRHLPARVLGEFGSVRVLQDWSSVGGAAACDITQLMTRHLVLHGVAAAAIEQWVTLVARVSPSYLELLLSDDGATVGLLFELRGRELATDLSALLQACEVGAPLLAHLVAFHQRLNRGRSLLRLELATGAQPRPTLGLIQRCPMPLERCLELFAAQPALCSQVRGCATVLQQQFVHGLELSVSARCAQPQLKVRFAVTVTARRHEDVRMALACVASRYAPCAAAVSRWAEHHDSWVAPELAVLSLWMAPALSPPPEVRPADIRAAQMCPAEICIEYPQVAVHAAAAWLEERSSEVASRFEHLCALGGRSALSYLEVRLQQSAWPRLQAAVSVG